MPHDLAHRTRHRRTLPGAQVTEPPADTMRPGIGITLAAWVVLLSASLLPVVVGQEVLGRTVSADAKAAGAVAVIVIGLLLTVAWRPWRAMRPFLWVLLALVGAQWAVYTQLDRLPVFRTSLASPWFGISMIAEQALNLIVAAVIVLVLLIVHRDRRAFYLAKGDVSAPAAPIGWLGVRPGDRWSSTGRNLTIGISLGTLAFLIISGQPPMDLVIRVLPLMPVILLAAAANAFSEEVSYKASLLSVLVGPMGGRQALRMVAAYFGIAHFYGVPYGLVGVALAWFLGWILAKSMLETRGMAWAWFIHFVQDVLIFSFLAIGAITPGGA
jgi:hypothetical protein